FFELFFTGVFRHILRLAENQYAFGEWRRDHISIPRFYKRSGTGRDPDRDEPGAALLRHLHDAALHDSGRSARSIRSHRERAVLFESANRFHQRALASATGAAANDLESELAKDTRLHLAVAGVADQN